MSAGSGIYDLIEESQEENGSIFSLSFFLVLTTLILVFYLSIRMVQKAKQENHLEMEDGFGKILVGFLLWWTRFAHVDSIPLQRLPPLESTEEADEIAAISDITKPAHIKAIGPHRTGLLDGLATVSKIPKGPVPRFFATDAWNGILPFGVVPKFFNTMSTIVVPSRLSSAGKTGVIELGVEALKKGDNIGIFPQGNLCRFHCEPPMIYSGAARMAIKANAPIVVIRLDGFWCLKNRFIPEKIRDNPVFRAMVSFFFRNNISTTVCEIIDLHIQQGDKQLSDSEIDELIFEINARLYAWFRETDTLTHEAYKEIQRQIKSGYHRELWENKFGQYTIDKQLRTLKTQYQELESSHSLVASLPIQAK